MVSHFCFFMSDFEIYEPREDSFLLQKQIKDYAKGDVLDMGTGSGILAAEALKYADRVVAVDINPKVISHCKKLYPAIEFRESDLFSNISADKKFDLIIFNPPYLPDEPLAPDIALDGGPLGFELIECFLQGVSDYLEPDGKILLLFSSHSRPAMIHKVLKKKGFRYKLIATEKLAFEELYVYVISRFPVLHSDISLDMNVYNIKKDLKP